MNQPSMPVCQNLFSEHNPESHPIWFSIFLHLIPGLLALAVFAAITGPVRNAGFPSMMAWLMTVACINIPFELGILFWTGYNRNRRVSLKGVISYNQRLNWKQVVLWTIGTFGAVLALFVLSAPLGEFLKQRVFDWIPAGFILDSGIGNIRFSRMSLLILNYASIIVFVLAIPVVEELYFRGFLLPRIARLRIWAVVINSFLFALYHFTTPWLLLSRFLFILPLAYVAYRRKNLLVPILIHAVGNSVDVVAGFLSLYH